MSLGTVVSKAILSRDGDLYRFRNEIEKTGLFTGGRLFYSVESQIDEIVADLIRLRAEKKARKEKEERINNLKVGDEVTVVGFGRHSEGSCASFQDTHGVTRFRVTGFSGKEGEYPFHRIVVGHLPSLKSDNRWEIHASSITEVFPAPVQKFRGPERRIERQDMVRTGSELHLVKTIEAVSRLRSLSEDETEALKAAQARIRKDKTANGFRKGGDRRINGQF